MNEGARPRKPLRARGAASPGEIPRTGALLLLAIRPCAGVRVKQIVEGLRRSRDDVEVHVLSRAAGGPDLKAALRSLRRGLAVAVVQRGRTNDGAWRCHAERVIAISRRCGAPLLPMEVDRAGSARAGRTAARSRIRTGTPVAARELAGRPAAIRTIYLRLLMDAARPVARDACTRALAPLAAPRPAQAMAREVDALAAHRLLLQRAPFQVFMARAGEAPGVLAEICRLRELSFRAVGEGSGAPSDRDGFDEHYEHLFVWHRELREIVGAYRLAFSEEVLPSFGTAGLYTSTLFNYDERVFDHVGSAMELGRSFVAPAWQRSFQPLLLLWSGIMVLAASRPGLRCLFGPVSISGSYSTAARALMTRSLMSHFGDPVLSALVRPRHPLSWPSAFGYQRQLASALADPALLSKVVARMERGAGLPVLVRKYLELQGRFAGFTVDDSFGSTLDGLVFVDVRRIPLALLERARGDHPRLPSPDRDSASRAR